MAFEPGQVGFEAGSVSGYAAARVVGAWVSALQVFPRLWELAFVQPASPGPWQAEQAGLEKALVSEYAFQATSAVRASQVLPVGASLLSASRTDAPEVFAQWVSLSVSLRV